MTKRDEKRSMYYVGSSTTHKNGSQSQTYESPSLHHFTSLCSIHQSPLPLPLLSSPMESLALHSLLLHPPSHPFSNSHFTLHPNPPSFSYPSLKSPFSTSKSSLLSKPHLLNRKIHSSTSSSSPLSTSKSSLLSKSHFLNLKIQSLDRKSTRLNSSHSGESRMPSSA